ILPDYVTYGNVAVDNIIDDDLYFTLQDYYENNNIYDELFTTDSTDAGSTTLDVTDWTCEEYGLTCVTAGSTIALVTVCKYTISALIRFNLRPPNIR
ncbi:unnamed protein product, partial [marine sediment metagenome]